MSPAEAARRLERLRAAIAPASRRALLVVGGNSTRLLREGYLSGQRLGARSGRLRNSTSMQVTQDADGVTLRVSVGRGDDVRYAAIQEYGGTIRPKRGRFLAIPVGPAVTPAGVTRGGWESPRTAPAKLRFVPIRGGRMARLVIDRRNRSETAYLLVRSVTIRAKHFMRDTERAAVAAFPEALSAQLQTAIRATVGA